MEDEKLEENVVDINVDSKAEEEIKRFVAVVEDPAEGVVFQVNGLDMNEALILMLKGKLKFQKLYDKWLEEQV